MRRSVSNRRNERYHTAGLAEAVRNRVGAAGGVRYIAMMSERSSVDQTLDEASPRYFGWRVVAALFLVAVAAWGFGFYGQGVFLAELSRVHGWPASLVSGAITVYYLVSAGIIAYVSDIMHRLGPKGLMLCGIACLGASTASLTLISRPSASKLAGCPAMTTGSAV